MQNLTIYNADGTGKLASGRIGNFHSTEPGFGQRITRTNTAINRVYADNNGAVLWGTGSVPDIRGGLYRTLLNEDQTGGNIRVHALMGQLKSYDAFWNNEVVSAVHGRMELVRSAHALTFGGYGVSAAVMGIPSVSGAVTVNTNHVLAGVAAISDFRATLTQTGKTAGLFVGKYDTTNWSDATARTTWGYGLLIADSAAGTGISIGICATAGLAITGASATGISISGACTDGIKVSGICADGIDISGAATTTGLNISGNCVTGITIGTQTTAGITIGTATTGMTLTGTYTNGIDLTAATMTEGSDNALFSIGSYSAAKSVTLVTSGFYTPLQVNLLSAANPSSETIMSGSYIKTATTGNQANMNIVGETVRVTVNGNVAQAYGVQCHLTVSGACVAGTNANVCAGSFKTVVGAAMTATVNVMLLTYENATAAVVSGEKNMMTLDPTAAVTNIFQIYSTANATNFFGCAARAGFANGASKATQSGASAGSLKIVLGGTDFYIPYFT